MRTLNGFPILLRHMLVAVVLSCFAWVCGYKLTPRLKEYLSWQYLIAFCNKFDGNQSTGVSDVWCALPSPLLWGHAGGGQLGFYTNSKEAIEESIRLGYKVIEVDISLTSDNVPVLSHKFSPGGILAFPQRPSLDEFMCTPICGRWTPLSLKDLIDLYADSDVVFSIDPHLDDFDLIGYMKRHAPKAFLERCIYQIYTVSDFKRLAADNPFGALHYCIDESLLARGGIPQLIKMLTTLGVNSVSFGERPISKEIMEAIACFRNANIVVSIACVNTRERALEWLRIGANCFDSDLLVPDDIIFESAAEAEK